MCLGPAYTSLLLFRFISPLCDSPSVVIVKHAMAEAAKKRRVGDPGAGVDPAQPPPQEERPLMCQQAQKVLQQYSLGVHRLPLDGVGVSPLNRHISGSHVHALGERILTVEGFVVWRYRYGWAHEPNPADPMEVARNTNKVAGVTPLLVKVPMVALKGSIAKTHLLSFLQCLKAGTVYWDKTKKLMLPPAACAALMEHMSHGMFYEVFSYAAIKNDRDAVLALCAADNFDSAFALGETEATLLRSIHSRLALDVSAGARDHTLQWTKIQEMTAASCGQKWEEVDVIAVFNFAKVVGKAHVDFVLTLCQYTFVGMR
jgi:hypothetical protein